MEKTIQPGMKRYCPRCLSELKFEITETNAFQHIWYDGKYSCYTQSENHEYYEFLTASRTNNILLQIREINFIFSFNNKNYSISVSSDLELTEIDIDSCNSYFLRNCIFDIDYQNLENIVKKINTATLLY